MSAEDGGSIIHRLVQHAWVRHRYWFFGTLGIGLIIMAIMLGTHVDLQWYWLLIYAALILPWAPYITRPDRYFRGGLTDKRTGVWPTILLTSSVSISWVFAKSINNAAGLGADYGVLGGLAYAAYYTSLPAVGIVIYFLRTRHGYRSLPEAINARYGTLATLAFGLAVLYRLYQEVWSNAVVVASFFGSTHSAGWWLGATLSTLIPVIYSFTGGMRASVVTDFAQSTICIAFLLALLIVLGVNMPANILTWNPLGKCDLATSANPTPDYQQCALGAEAYVAPQGASESLAKASSVFSYANASCDYSTIDSQSLCTSVGGTWSSAACSYKLQPPCTLAGGSWIPHQLWSLYGGVDLLLVGLLQGCFSYPFFDPVLTDRAFLTAPKTMLVSFILAGFVAGGFIWFFSWLGIIGNMIAVLQPDRVPAAAYAGALAGAPSAVTKIFGTAFFSIVNLIFIVESLSTLDSTFTSVAKLFGPEFIGILSNGEPAVPQSATKRQLLAGRLLIIVIAVLGMLPLLSTPTVLDATTVSGTIVLGLGPPVFALLFVKGYRPLTFHIPFWWGVGLGVTYQLSTSDCCQDSINMSGFAWGAGSSATLLGTNVIGSIVAFGLCAITLMENPLSADMTRRTSDGNNVFRAWIQPLLRIRSPVDLPRIARETSGDPKLTHVGAGTLGEDETKPKAPADIDRATSTMPLNQELSTAM